MFCLQGRQEITDFLVGEDASKLEFEAPWPSLYFDDEEIDEKMFSFLAHDYIVKMGVPKPLIENEFRMAVTRLKYKKKVKKAARILTQERFQRQRFIYRGIWLTIMAHYDKITKLIDFCSNDRTEDHNFEAFPIAFLYLADRKSVV